MLLYSYLAPGGLLGVEEVVQGLGEDRVGIQGEVGVLGFQRIQAEAMALESAIGSHSQ